MNDHPIVRELRRPPSAKWFMARAFLPRPQPRAVPALALRRSRAGVPLEDLHAYLRLTGRRAGASLPMEWPQVWSFRMQMALLTDRRFPLPIWNALQVRNRLVQHEPLPVDARYTVTVQPNEMRRLDKGTEIDLHTTLHEAGGRCVWEGTTAFYWRGVGRLPGSASPADASSPGVAGEVVAHWGSGEGEGWHFGGLTGDYNGLHWNDRYARAFGFARAFHHPPRVVGQCLAHMGLDDAAPRQELSLWIKGPVYYHSDLQLRRADEGDARLFAVHVDGDARPALVGRWSGAPT